jgi:hypothetical protein
MPESDDFAGFRPFFPDSGQVGRNLEIQAGIRRLCHILVYHISAKLAETDQYSRILAVLSEFRPIWLKIQSGHRWVSTTIAEFRFTLLVFFHTSQTP